MHFTGEIYFNFDTYDVWRLYTILLRASRAKHVSVAVEWRPLLTSDVGEQEEVSRSVRGLAACEFVRMTQPGDYDKFARALLTMAYQEKDDPGSKKILAVAAHVAGINAGDVISGALESGLSSLRESTEAARKKGVAMVPTIVRQGPPLYVKTTGAANYGDSVPRLELINRMLDEDGIWTLSKP